ncbi:hypothetical protein, partial [Erythrobacter donghaensis]|uniref:hypothetical protein n=1 Tax=Erythrobacter donghaensis TaxID=267135 RepID=UPI001E61DEDE
STCAWAAPASRLIAAAEAEHRINVIARIVHLPLLSCSRRSSGGGSITQISRLLPFSRYI